MKIDKFLGFMLAGSLTLASCSDFLDTESPSEVTGQVIFENEGMAKSAVMGVYSVMTTTYVYGQKISVNWQGVSDIELASGYNDDPSMAGGDTGIANFFCNVNLQNTKWESIFQMAEFANTAVAGMRNSAALQTSKAIQGYYGEALTLRALANFELVRRYGDFPYKSEMSSSDLSNVYMGKIDRDSIYDGIIADIEEAIPYLPWMGEGEYTAERVNKGFAYGLLARVALFAGGWSVRDGNLFTDDSKVEKYPEGLMPGMSAQNGFYVGRPINWQKYYEIAERACAELIGSPQNPHKLDPDYGNIWKTVCSLNQNPHNENMLEVANGVGQSGDIGTLMGRAMDGNLGYGQRGFGGSYVSTNGYYFYSFSPDDLRRDYATYWATYKKNSNNKNKIQEVMNNDIMNLGLGKWCFFWTADAYKQLNMTATSRVPTGINWIIMRYSDVLLMFAEAVHGLGKSIDAVDATAGMSARQAFERVRERAFGTGSASITQYDSDFFEAIVNERAWEFGGESIRKLDLVRWGLLDKKIEDMKRAMVYMMDGTHTIQCFDKTYEPGEIPEKLYYKYQADGEFIDWSSVNFYTQRAASPGSEYTENRWIPANYWNRESESAAQTLIKNSAKVLACASGLRAEYDYSELLGTLTWGAQIDNYIKTTMNRLGNGVCNYRHLYPIYYEDIVKSNGYLTNSYGY